MAHFPNSTSEDISDILGYAGLVLIAFELIKNLVIKPIKNFYADIAFAPGMPFVSYENDVKALHKNEFEACLLYLQDKMQAIDTSDIRIIHALRTHRNVIAHELPICIKDLRIEEYAELLKATDKVLFKLSNYNTYIELGADPMFKSLNFEWSSVQGNEHILYCGVLERMDRLKARLA
jgi:hypothetical protein